MPLVDSDGESISQPFPTVPNTDSDLGKFAYVVFYSIIDTRFHAVLGSPYENVRPTSKTARSVTTDPSPSTSPQRWDYQRHARPPEPFDDRRVSGVSRLSM